MNAKMARKNVENYLERVNNARIKRVEEYLETTVEIQINKASNQGRTEVFVEKMAFEEENEILQNKLENLGFKVSDKGVKFSVEW
jgi:flagellar basal body-associated protein FliL